MRIDLVRRALLFGTLLGLLLTGTRVLAQRGSDDIDYPTWSTLKGYYNYNSAQPLEVETKDLSTTEFYRQHIFLGTKEGKIPALFMRPLAPKAYPCILLLHGYTSKKEDMITRFGDDLVSAGFAVFALDAPQHGERKPKEAPTGLTALATITKQGVLDYRYALDYLKTRKDVKTKEIGLVGYSMGAMMGTILTAVEPRIKASVLCVVGDIPLLMLKTTPKAQQSDLFSVCNSLYAGKIAPRPVLFLNGRKDNIVPYIATMKTYDAAKDGKEIVWYDSGHILPKESTDKVLEWLKERFPKK